MYLTFVQPLTGDLSARICNSVPVLALSNFLFSVPWPCLIAKYGSLVDLVSTLAVPITCGSVAPSSILSRYLLETYPVLLPYWIWYQPLEHLPFTWNTWPFINLPICEYEVEGPVLTLNPICALNTSEHSSTSAITFEDTLTYFLDI